MRILGIWDGHDSGAAVVEGGRILVALNEERLTRRKSEVCFPSRSIRGCLDYLGLRAGEIEHVAVSSSGFSNALTRIFPRLKEEYYLIRRHMKPAGRFDPFKKRSKYLLTDPGSGALTRSLSAMCVRGELRRYGFRRPRLRFVDHHLCHAAAAAFCSGFSDCLVVTMDGVGDGLSATVRSYAGGVFSTLAVVPGRHSIGLFFEHVTNLMGMKELEDEGAVMALADHAAPVPDAENPLLDLVHVDGLGIRCAHVPLKMYDVLKEICARYPPERFACMAQRTLEVRVPEWIGNALSVSGHDRVALAGGVFSNIKVNRRIRTLAGVKACFVFPHMGDGGLAAGAALYVDRDLNAAGGFSGGSLEDVALGLEHSEEEMRRALDAGGLEYRHCPCIEEETAELIAQGRIVFWFQGRMEYGPRALGHRSILARPDVPSLKDALNVRLKKRYAYQPFCPTMLEEEAGVYLEDHASGRFMTMAYMVKKDRRAEIEGVISVDGSCRPQIIPAGGSRYGALLAALKRRTGKGVVLNTSFNIHGEPLVCSPRDAVDTFVRVDEGCLAMGPYLVTGRGS